MFPSHWFQLYLFERFVYFYLNSSKGEGSSNLGQTIENDTHFIMLNICSSLLVPGSSYTVWIRNNIVVHVYILYSCTIFTGWWPNRHPPSWSSNSSCWAPKTNHNPIHDQIWACKSLRNKGTADCVGFLNIYLLPPDENFCKPCYIILFISKLCVIQGFRLPVKIKKRNSGWGFNLFLLYPW